MSYKFDSLMIILNKLESAEKVTISSLSEELEVTGRSIHRYIKTLQTAGFPIIYDKHKNGYVFRQGFTLKKPDLSPEERLAFTLAGKFLANFGPGMEKSINNIKKKLSTSSSSDTKHIFFKGDYLSPSSEKYLNLINRAILNYQRIRMEYKSLNANKARESRVDPYYLFFRDGIWYLRGYHYRDRAARTFALDRIISLTVLDEYFIPEHISPEEELDSAIGPFIDGTPVEVELQFAAESEPFIFRKKWHKSQKLVKLPDGRIEMTLTVKGLLGIRRWLYQWIPHVKVIRPEELKKVFREDIIAEIAFMDQ